MDFTDAAQSQTFHKVLWAKLGSKCLFTEVATSSQEEHKLLVSIQGLFCEI